MRKFLALMIMMMISFSINTIAQQLRETSLSFGISQTSPAIQSRYWDEPIPAYLKLGISKSWSAENKRISLRKEIGLNLQYAKISLTSGGLGAQGYLSGNILSLFADAAIMPNIQITNSLGLCIGPEIEFLTIGKNHLNDSYSSSYMHYSGEKRNDKINREYFQEPSFGVKMRLYESGINNRVTIGIETSYLWTKQLDTNFNADNYKRISIFLGFKNKKKDILSHPEN